MNRLWATESRLAWPSPAIVFDGAHWSPAPTVGVAYATMGRGPGPFQGLSGTRTVPVTAIGSSLMSCERYMMRVARAPLKVEGSDLITSPASPAGRGEGG